MTSTHALDWIVALLVCWASLTAILQSPEHPARCDGPYVTNSTPQAPALPTPAEADAMIRDMKLHD